MFLHLYQNHIALKGKGLRTSKNRNRWKSWRKRPAGKGGYMSNYLLQQEKSKYTFLPPA